MASNVEEEEGKIPVFTVLKNNTILKNIFIVNKPPDPSPAPSTTSHEDVLMVGRHPDCDLMLTHPSISRFHLEIRSTPSSQSLSVLDLSSVHGTWVSGKKVEPGVSVEMKEGDTLRIGVSSRVYRLHWIPISRAYDMENPFVSQLDVVPEEEQAAEEEEEEEERKQRLKNCCPVEMEEIQSVDSILECISFLFLDENLEVTAENEIPAAPPMPEDIVSFFCEEERKIPLKDETFGVLNDPFGAETPYLSTTSNGENKICDSPNQLLNVNKEIPSATPIPEDIISFCCEEEMKSQSRDETFGVPSADGENKLCDSLNQVRSPPYVESVDECDNMWTEYLSESICLPTVEAVQGTKMLQFYTPPDTFTSPLPSGLQDSSEKHWSSLLTNTDLASFDGKSAAEAIIPTESEFECTVKDNGRVTDNLTAGVGVFNYENTFLPVEEVILDTNCQQIKVVVVVDSLSDGEKQDPCGEEYKSKLQTHLNAKSSHEQGHSLDEIVKDIGNKCTGGICSTSLQVESVNSSMPPEAVLKIMKESQTLQQSNTEVLGSCVEVMAKRSTNGNIWSRRGKVSSAPQIRTSKSISKSTANVDTEVTMSKKKDIINKTISNNLFCILDGEEDDDEIFTPDKENFSPNTLQLLCSKKKGRLEEIKLSRSQRSHNSKDNFSSDVYPDEVISPTSSKESRKDLFSVLDGEKEEEIFTPDKENFSANTLQLHLLKKKGNLEEIKCSKAQWSQNSESKFSANINPDESISPSSNKENQAPKVTQEHKSRRKPFGSLELAQRSRNSKRKFSANIYPDVGISPTSKRENPTPKVAQEHKSQRKPFGRHIELAKEQDIMTLNNSAEERAPFQLLMDEGGKSKSGTSSPVSAAKGIDISNCGQISDKRIKPSDISWDRKRSWDVVVDTSTLMNKESRKALQLLQGLRGTRLIIPRLVIRELDSMKRQFSIFRRISEASLALEWIEKCMVKTSWWIHIQSSMEEERLIAPTPPASPDKQFSEESWTFPVGIGSPSSHKCSMELVSPTAEDHILDFALLYRRRQNDGQLVMLSEDVTLKIKCMAEGLLCEPVQEFRESLVNPFSERFLWTNSSPRGQTWSCEDDVVLRERYRRMPKTKSSKSGLKLILLHNSQYGHRPTY